MSHTLKKKPNVVGRRARERLVFTQGTSIGTLHKTRFSKKKPLVGSTRGNSLTSRVLAQRQKGDKNQGCQSQVVLVTEGIAGTVGNGVVEGRVSAL